LSSAKARGQVGGEGERKVGACGRNGGRGVRDIILKLDDISFSISYSS
jgi:hypothetical protein